MRIKLEIVSTEPFTIRRNVDSIIEMVLEECEGRRDSGSTSYQGNGGTQTCKYRLIVTDK